MTNPTNFFNACMTSSRLCNFALHAVKKYTCILLIFRQTDKAKRGQHFMAKINIEANPWEVKLFSFFIGGSYKAAVCE